MSLVFHYTLLVIDSLAGLGTHRQAGLETYLMVLFSFCCSYEVWICCYHHESSELERPPGNYAIHFSGEMAITILNLLFLYFRTRRGI